MLNRENTGCDKKDKYVHISKTKSVQHAFDKFNGWGRADFNYKENK